MSSQTPRVSVVAAIFNGGNDTEVACRSVLDQSFTDLELVVVDDASSDDTQDILSRLAGADPRLRVFRNPRQSGQTPSLNRGVALSRGEFIARIDADDRFLPGKLARQVAYLDAHPEVALVGSWAMRVTDTGTPMGLFCAPTDSAEIAYRLLHTSPICHVSVLMRRDAVVRAGGYVDGFRYAADYKLWSDMRRAGCTLANIPDVLVEYRVSESTFGRASRFAAADEAARIIRENAGSLAGVDLPLSVCRAIDLRAAENGGLSDEARLRAFCALDTLARASYGRRSWPVARRLFLEAMWSFAMAGTQAPASVPPVEEERLAPVRPPVWLTAARALGRASRAVGLERLSRLKALVRRQTPVG